MENHDLEQLPYAFCDTVLVMIEGEQELVGERLEPEQTIQFSCRPGLRCFNSCCRDKRLQLFPYDMLRLRRALDSPSQQVLEQHVELEIDPSSGWPALRIRLEADGRCPFVTDRGCRIYEHRPTCCRIFPLARAVGRDEEIFLAERRAGCLGWEEPRTLTVEQWLQEQGLADYRRANNRVSQLFLHHGRRQRRMDLSQQQIHAVIMTLYNLDVFREAVARPGFARCFGLQQERVDAALSSDEALLELGQDWLTKQLFG